MSMLLITVGRLRDGGMPALDRYGEAVEFLESAEYRAQVRHRDEAFVELHSYIAADLLEVART